MSVHVKVYLHARTHAHTHVLLDDSCLWVISDTSYLQFNAHIVKRGKVFVSHIVKRGIVLVSILLCILWKLFCTKKPFITETGECWTELKIVSQQK